MGCLAPSSCFAAETSVQIFKVKRFGINGYSHSVLFLQRTLEQIQVFLLLGDYENHVHMNRPDGFLITLGSLFGGSILLMVLYYYFFIEQSSIVQFLSLRRLW